VTDKSTKIRNLTRSARIAMWVGLALVALAALYGSMFALIGGMVFLFASAEYFWLAEDEQEEA
jgi:hypothetical protein